MCTHFTKSGAQLATAPTCLTLCHSRRTWYNGPECAGGDSARTRCPWQRAQALRRSSWRPTMPAPPRRRSRHPQPDELTQLRLSEGQLESQVIKLLVTPAAHRKGVARRALDHALSVVRELRKIAGVPDPTGHVP